ncbi:MAG: heme-binding protein [Actinomycetales bacterium]|nr:heme-binding protein [Actinomycetales bacterium]
MTQEQVYKLVSSTPNFELRIYSPCVLAEIEIDAEFESAASNAFRHLFNYINGGNQSERKIAMTAPVLQIDEGELLNTETDPAKSTQASDRHLVSFVMPAQMTYENTPQPRDSRVRIRALPEQLVATRKFSGRWTHQKYLSELRTLRTGLHENGLVEIDKPRFARFDAPWTPWFLRRNEIQIPVQEIGERT